MFRTPVAQKLSVAPGMMGPRTRTSTLSAAVDEIASSSLGVSMSTLLKPILLLTSASRCDTSASKIRINDESPLANKPRMAAPFSGHHRLAFRRTGPGDHDYLRTHIEHLVHGESASDNAKIFKQGIRDSPDHRRFAISSRSCGSTSGTMPSPQRFRECSISSSFAEVSSNCSSSANGTAKATARPSAREA